MNLKLVAIDLDGSLLRNDFTYEVERFNAVRQRLGEQGVRFAILSGHSRQDLTAFLSEMDTRDIYLTSHNGNYVNYNGKRLRKVDLPNDVLAWYKSKLQQFDNLLFIADDGEQVYAYQRGKSSYLDSELQRVYPGAKPIEDLDELKGRPLFKLAANFALERPDVKKLQRRLQEERTDLDVIVRRFDWLEVHTRAGGKGAVLEYLQDLYAISKDETLTFGNKMNDASMNQLAAYPVAMANAYIEYRKITPYVIGSNEEQALIRLLEEIADAGSLAPLNKYHNPEKEESNPMNTQADAHSSASHTPEVEPVTSPSHTQGFVGKARGMAGDVALNVEFAIQNIEIVQEQETVGIGDLALQTLPGQIIAKNSLDVDTISSATVTSNAIRNAIIDAAQQAVDAMQATVDASSGASIHDSHAESEPVTVGEGEYIGRAQGLGGELVVRVTTSDGQSIDQVEVLSHKETPGIGTKAIDALPAQIVSANSTDVDSISGASITSSAIKEAVEQAMAGGESNDEVDQLIDTLIQDQNLRSAFKAVLQEHLPERTTGEPVHAAESASKKPIYDQRSVEEIDADRTLTKEQKAQRIMNQIFYAREAANAEDMTEATDTPSTDAVSSASQH